MFFKDK